MKTHDLAAARSVNWLFILLFAAGYGVLYLLYSTVPDSVLQDDVYYLGITCPAKVMINWFDPSQHALAIQNRLESAKVALSVVRGCDGAGVICLMIAAILACRAPLKRTLLGLVGAVALVYCLNQVRIVVLYFVQEYRRAWFTPLHVYFIPTLMILVGALYFAFWIGWAQHGVAARHRQD